jgi:hypothetical protein
VSRYQAVTLSLCLCVSVSEEALASVSPYQAVTFPFTPAQTKLLVEQYAADILRKVRAAKAALSLAPPPPVGPEHTGILFVMQACILDAMPLCPIQGLRSLARVGPEGAIETERSSVGILTEASVYRRRPRS